MGCGWCFVFYKHFVPIGTMWTWYMFCCYQRFVPIGTRWGLGGVCMLQTFCPYRDSVWMWYVFSTNILSLSGQCMDVVCFFYIHFVPIGTRWGMVGVLFSTNILSLSGQERYMAFVLGMLVELYLFEYQCTKICDEAEND